MVTATPAVLTDHGVDDIPGNRAVTPVVEHAHILPGHPRFAGQLQTDLVIDVEGANGHPDGLAQIVDLIRVNPLSQ